MTDRYWIAVDMDGTLLNNGDRSQSEPVLFCKMFWIRAPCPSRYGKGIAASSGKIKNLSGISYAVLGNGSVVWDWKKTCALYKNVFRKDRQNRS